MKTKINLTIDEDLVPKSKDYAKKHGVSVSQLVEEMLREKINKVTPSFSTRWRGKLKADKKDGLRYKNLKQRYSI